MNVIILQKVASDIHIYFKPAEGMELTTIKMIRLFSRIPFPSLTEPIDKRP